MIKKIWHEMSKQEAKGHQDYKFNAWMWLMMMFLLFGLLGGVNGLLGHSNLTPGNGLLRFHKIPLSLTLFLSGQLAINALVFFSALFKMPAFTKLMIIKAVSAFIMLLLCVFSTVILDLILSGMRCCGITYRAFENGNSLTYLALYSFCLSAVMVVYTFNGSRPNLIYKYRTKQTT